MDVRRALDPVPEAILVGFSGGLDSTVLLHALIAGCARLRAVHVHHGLHPDADTWVVSCQRTCDALRVPLSIVRVRVATAGQGREAAARHARYAAFAAELQPGETLALAHHRGDQAETFLLRALRGSGVDGLAAMQRWRPSGTTCIWRPLLGVGRDDIQRYAREHALAWIEDPGNDDTTLDRNFLRQRVLPLLQERWPHADAALARSAGLCAQASSLLEAQDEQALVDARRADPASLDVVVLRTLSPERRARAWRRWIHELGLPALPAEGIARIERDLMGTASDRSPRFAWSGAEVRRWRDTLHAMRPRGPLPVDWCTQWDGARPLSLPGGGLLELQGVDRLEKPVMAHARRGGERICLAGRLHAHALKHVLQERAVPPWDRARLPLLSTVDGVLLAAGDGVLSAAFEAWLRARGARLVLLPDAD